MVDELRWLLGLNLVLAIWLGILADSWKSRHMYGWMAIGLCTSLLGVVVLALLPKLPRTKPGPLSASGTIDFFGR